MVIGEAPEAQLAPFDENLELLRYQEKTKAELIQESKDSIEHYRKGVYAEYLKNPEEYAKDARPQHLNYLKEEFPKKLEWTDEEHYKYATSWYEPENIDEEGNVYSTCNPQAKWDWYSLGGRWSGLIKLKEGAVGTEGMSGVFNNETGIDQARKGDITNINEIKTYAVIKNGKWHERGQMGWFGMASNEKEVDVWDKQIEELLADVSDDTLISIYDCHI
jgi:hypothetical protein